MADGAVLETCVLIPMSLGDVLLRAAQRDLYRARWSEPILAEVERNLVKLAVPPDKAARRVAAMRRAFARAEVTGFHDLIEQMSNHRKDRHVLAAAVHAGAKAIVTFNIKDFQTRHAAQAQVRAVHPDAFLVDLYALYPEDMVAIIGAQAAALVRYGRHWSAHDVLDSLDRQGCRHFIALLRPHIR